MFTLKYERRRRRSAKVSKDVPQEILFAILARLPVKYLLRFRCVCKSWYTLISSPSFINTHHERSVMKSACDYLLVQSTNRKCLSLYCAQTFAKCLDLELPRHRNGFYFSVYGSCNGLLCISDSTYGGFKSLIYLCNPSIRKFKKLPRGLIRVRNTCTSFFALGFAHCSGNDYKVVRIVRFANWRSVFDVEVYSLNRDSWRKISSVLPVSREVYLVQGEYACLNGVVYWIIQENDPRCKSILSFDMDGEIFQKVMIPERLRSLSDAISIRSFDKSLSLLHLRPTLWYCYWYCDIWVLEMDTWKMKRRNLLPRYGWIAWPLSYTTNGGLHVVTISENRDYGNLVLYDHTLQQDKDLGIKLSSNRHGGSFIDVYKESLILLNS